MALIKCKKCGKEISDKTTSCVHCGAPTRPNGVNSSRKLLNWIKKHTILLSVVVVLFITIIIVKMFFVSFIRVSGSSMEPTLKNGELRIVNKVGKIERFDIVVFKDENNNLSIKRIYGLPEETISIYNDAIQIGSKRIVEDKYANGSMKGSYSVTLKSDEYYVLGDNRDNSLDSRYFGPIKKSSIKGKLYGGNDKEIEIIEEITKVVKINYEIKNKGLVSDKYNFYVYKPYNEVVVRGRKENIDKIDHIEVIVDFKDVDVFRVGSNPIYDLPLIVYDRNNNRMNGIEIIPRDTVSVSIDISEK